MIIIMIFFIAGFFLPTNDTVIIYLYALLSERIPSSEFDRQIPSVIAVKLDYNIKF